jgi:hypothetical protein
MQQNRFPRQLSVDQMRTRYLMQAPKGKPIGKTSCKLLSDRPFCRFCVSATVLKWVEPVTNSL